MLLRVKVFSSTEWFERVFPAFSQFGLKNIASMTLSDPETDGELKEYFFEYAGEEPLSCEDLAAFLGDMKKIITDSEAPFIEFYFVSK